jgi:hypothetical protein
MDGEVIAAGAVALWYFLRNRGKKDQVEPETERNYVQAALPVAKSVALPFRNEPAPVISAPLPLAEMQKLAIKEGKTAVTPAPTLIPAPEVLAPPTVAQRTHGFQRKSFQPRGNLYDAGGRTWPPALPTFLK